MLATARRQWRWMTAGIVLGVTVIAANALLMALSGWFITSMAVAGALGTPFNYGLPAVGIRVLAIMRTMGRYAERLVTHEAAFRVLADVRVWLFRRLVPLAPAGLEHYAGGDVAGRLRADVDSLENLYLRIFAPLVTGVMSILLAVVFSTLWSVPAALVLLVFLLLSGLALPLLAVRLAREPGGRSTTLAGELRSCVTEGLQGAEELILLGAQELQAAQIDALSGRLVAEQQRLGRIGGLTLGGGVASGGLGVAAVLAVGSISLQSGQLTAPMLVMLLLFSAAAFEAAGTMPGALQLLPAAREAVRRISELADAKAPVAEPALPQLLPQENGIHFLKVSFSYTPGLPVLRGFSLAIAAGERVALVGPSGAGKSSLVELLLRFRAYDGSITLGTAELRELAGDDVRERIAALPQRPHLFNSSIRENILLGNRDATDQQLQQVLEDAGLSAWVAGLPQGMDTLVGEGGSALSGGEVRRVALARALLKDAPILLLDEPTEGLDAAKELEVVERLARRIGGKTVLIITHRPACLALADRVVRMEIED